MSVLEFMMLMLAGGIVGVVGFAVGFYCGTKA